MKSMVVRKTARAHMSMVVNEGNDIIVTGMALAEEIREVIGAMSAINGNLYVWAAVSAFDMLRIMANVFPSKHVIIHEVDSMKHDYRKRLK